MGADRRAPGAAARVIVLLWALAGPLGSGCRPRGAPGADGRPGGTAFVAAMDGVAGDAREEAIAQQLRAGNTPAFLRALRTVHDTAVSADGRRHVIAYEVMPDYLAIGNDRDFVRMPMTPRTAQAYADANGFVLPTRRIVNAIWRAADVRLEPQPLTEAREASATFLQHHRLVEAQRGTRSPALVAGHKKDVVVSNRLLERRDRVAIYGWHRPNGTPIQPLYVGHVNWYVDYSHGARLVRRIMRVDGGPMPFEQIATHPLLHVLVSDEGPLRTLRADGGDAR